MLASYLAPADLAPDGLYAHRRAPYHRPGRQLERDRRVDGNRDLLGHRRHEHGRQLRGGVVVARPRHALAPRARVQLTRIAGLCSPGTGTGLSWRHSGRAPPPPPPGPRRGRAAATGAEPAAEHVGPDDPRPARGGRTRHGHRRVGGASWSHQEMVSVRNQLSLTSTARQPLGDSAPADDDHPVGAATTQLGTVRVRREASFQRLSLGTPLAP